MRRRPTADLAIVTHSSLSLITKLVSCVTKKPAENSNGPPRIAGCSCATWPPRFWSTARSRPPWPRPRKSSRYTEKLITLAKDGWNLDHFRRCLAVLTSKDVAYKLFHEIGPRYKDRSGGYTRIYKLAKVRQGDAAPMAVIALLGEARDDQGTGQAGRRRLAAAPDKPEPVTAEVERGPDHCAMPAAS